MALALPALCSRFQLSGVTTECLAQVSSAAVTPSMLRLSAASFVRPSLCTFTMNKLDCLLWASAISWSMSASPAPADALTA